MAAHAAARLTAPNCDRASHDDDEILLFANSISSDILEFAGE